MRYAVYFTPPAGSPLAEAGARFLGRDPFTGESLPQPAIAGLAAERVSALTADPRRYGFHATLKPPFSLADGRSEADLLAAFRDFAGSVRAFAAPLEVSRIAGFVALTPSRPSADLDRLAAAAVEVLDPFRAPPSPGDIDRRRRAGLSARQEANLAAWGYPYVFEDFRFHMTLSGRVEGPDADRIHAAAGAVFEPLLIEPVPVETLGLFVEPEPGAPFSVLATAPLSHR